MSQLAQRISRAKSQTVRAGSRHCWHELHQVTTHSYSDGMAVCYSGGVIWLFVLSVCLSVSTITHKRGNGRRPKHARHEHQGKCNPPEVISFWCWWGSAYGFWVNFPLFSTFRNGHFRRFLTVSYTATSWLSRNLANGWCRQSDESTALLERFCGHPRWINPEILISMTFWLWLSLHSLSALVVIVSNRGMGVGWGIPHKCRPCPRFFTLNWMM